MPLPHILATSLRGHSADRPDRHVQAPVQEFDKVLGHFVREKMGIPYISMFEDLCHSQVGVKAKSRYETSAGCPLYAAPGVPILFDTDHMTTAGSKLFASVIRSRNQLPY